MAAPRLLTSGSTRALPPPAAGKREQWPARAPTPFEERVYTVVRRIPKGQVRTYRWVAEQLGDAALARAVGNALNRNPDAPEIPCHRVIRSDGSLGGFARGRAAKRALLRREGWPRG